MSAKGKSDKKTPAIRPGADKSAETSAARPERVSQNASKSASEKVSTEMNGAASGKSDSNTPATKKKTLEPGATNPNEAAAANASTAKSVASASRKTAAELPVAKAAPKPKPTKPAAPEAASEPAKSPLPPLAEDSDIAGIVNADHPDPFGFLGMHELAAGGPLVIRAFLPQARRASVVAAKRGKVIAGLSKIHEDGLFAGAVEGRKERFAYRLRIESDDGESEIDDPYRFPPLLSERDTRLVAEGNHPKIYQKLGAHPMDCEGVGGTAFAVWAPNASRVAVIGSFNEWDGRCHGMRRRHECGVWEIFLPEVGAGELYKFEIKSGPGAKLTDKADPCAFLAERSPGTASTVYDLGKYKWRDSEWMKARKNQNDREAPMAIYEVYLGSWQRKPEEGHRWLTYGEFSEELVDYVKDMGFTHIELLPISEFDFDGSLGYQPSAPYAVTSRWGDPDAFRALVDRCHQEGIGVIVDWVPVHFSDDPKGLRDFDGMHLYEHPDPNRPASPRLELFDLRLWPP